MSSKIRLRAVDGPLVGLSALSGAGMTATSLVPFELEPPTRDISLKTDASDSGSIGMPGSTSPQSTECPDLLLVEADDHIVPIHGSSCEHRTGG